MAIHLARHRFSVDDYHRMGKIGVLPPDARVELLDGEVIEMSPIGRRHAAAVDGLTRAFVRRLGDAAIVRVQNPVRLDRRNEPVPDVALLRPRPGGYWTTVPGPKDILLIVEVSATSLTLDRRVKLPLYARAGVPEVWLLVIRPTRRRTQTASANGEITLEVHRQPAGDGYRETRIVHRGETVAPLLLPEQTFNIESLLGEAAP